MTPAEMREGVARAMREALRAEGSCVRGDVCADASCACCLEAADAALAFVREAVREPTPEMLEAGARAIACHSAPSGAQQWEALACWRAMLAASPLGDAP